MTPDRFANITARYKGLRIALIGDYCLDRYLEIDPAKGEVSIETGLPVYNVVNVRAQPGGAGTILNNLVALGVETIFPLGLAGEDGEGFELVRALAAKPGVRMDFFIQTPQRRTFTYCKPLLVEPGKAPRELNRLDQKNWTATPASISEQLGRAFESIAADLDGVILLEQVDQSGTGVLTAPMLETVRRVSTQRPKLLMLADSRLGLSDFPRVHFKMNAAELSALCGTAPSASVEEVGSVARTLARSNGKPVFVTLAERGMLAASPDGRIEHVPTLPVRGEVDIVGAGDAVTANLTAALAGGATDREALQLANAAASVVIHQLGTTGTASIEQVRSALSQGCP